MVSRLSALLTLFKKEQYIQVVNVRMVWQKKMSHKWDMKTEMEMEMQNVKYHLWIIPHTSVAKIDPKMYSGLAL